MRIKKNIQIVTAASQALALAFLIPLASFADETPPTAFSNNKLDNFEQVIYGAPRKNLSEDARLKALEIKLFGEAKSGSSESRIAAIQKALAYGRGGAASPDFLPPLAPTLDTSSNSGKTAKAPTYGDRNESFAANSDGSDSGLPDSTQAVADAMQLYTDGKVDQAEQAFRKIISNDPNNADAYYNLGVIAEGRGDLKSALNDYRQAQRINPQDQDLRDTVTTVANKLNAQKSVASAPGRAPSRGSSSSSYSSGSATTSAPNAFANSSNYGSAPSAADRNRLKAMVNDASTKYKKGDYDGAVSLLGQVANEAPGDADVQFALGQAYKAKGDMGRARTAMARAAALDPNNPSYQSALASLTSAAAASSVASSTGAADNGITPFAGSHAQPSGGLSGFTSHSGSSMNRRLTRAVEFGLAGAAVGGLTSALMSHRGGYGYGRSTGYSSMKSGALRGAVAGSVLGLIFGR
ncbi:MAG: tetratricopeptide repeat protein [Cyanobacteria bacterium SZAS LIN-3]|nr:tetratricopeptide repeat protein [Cyanobacteria bacterium SZAS LIN-3]